MPAGVAILWLGWLLLRGVGVLRLLFLPDFSVDEDVEGGPDDDVHYKQQRGPYVGR